MYYGDERFTIRQGCKAHARTWLGIGGSKRYGPSGSGAGISGLSPPVPWHKCSVQFLAMRACRINVNEPQRAVQLAFDICGVPEASLAQFLRNKAPLTAACIQMSMFHTLRIASQGSAVDLAAQGVVVGSAEDLRLSSLSANPALSLHPTKVSCPKACSEECEGMLGTIARVIRLMI